LPKPNTSRAAATPVVPATATSHETAALLCIVVLSVYLSYYLWGANLNAHWSLTDDQEILRLLGDDQKIGLFEIPHVWLSTEVGQFGSHVRYRPSYYFLRIWECFLWGPSPFLWYVSRLIMFAASFAIFAWLLSRVAGFFLGVVFALFVATGHYWAAIWATLGPAETYACFGAALYFLGMHLVLGSASRNSPGTHARIADSANWAILGAGAVIAMGSKENFILLAAPVAWLGVKLWRQRSLTFAGGLTTALVMAYAGAIALAVGLALASSGRDIYMNSVNPGDRLPMLFGAMTRAAVLWIFIFAGIAWLLLAVFRRSASSTLQRWRTYFGRLCYWEAILALVYMSQVYYYNTIWTPDSRYAFPGELVTALALLLPILLVLRSPDLLPHPAATNAQRLRLFVGICYLLLTWYNGFDISITRSRHHATFTRSVNEAITRVANAAARHPHAPIVLLTHTLGDYETYYSVLAFLRSQRVHNPILIEKSPSGYSPGGFAPDLATVLLKNVERLQLGADGFSPRSTMDTAEECLMIGITHDPPPTRCIVLGKLVP
jgi:hypothetical protein